MKIKGENRVNAKMVLKDRFLENVPTNRDSWTTSWSTA